MPPQKLTQLLLLALFCGAVLCALSFCELKRSALGFHTRDYAMYAQFAARLFDGGLEKKFSLNPHGKNFLGMGGVEGAGNFHRAIHFEPIKYAYALIYRLWRSPRALFIFVALLYYVPILYVGRCLPLTGRMHRAVAVLFGIVYVCFPSSLQTVAYDLRPFLFLAPFFAIAAFAVYFKRPAWEQLLAFNLLFCAREEALVLGGAIVLLSICRSLRDAGHSRVWVALAFSWICWWGIIRKYFAWAAYTVPPGENHVYLFLLEQVFVHPFRSAVAAAIFISAGLGLYSGLRRRRAWSCTCLEVLPLVLVLISFWWQIRLDVRQFLMTPAGRTPGDVWEYVVFSPRFGICFVGVLVFLTVFWKASSSVGIRAAVMFCFGAGICAGLWMNLLPAGTSLRGEVQRYLRRAPMAAAVFDVRAQVNPYRSRVLCDYATYQAFYDCDNVFVYNRLPWHVAGGDGRFFPRNIAALRVLVRDGIDVFVATAASRDTLEEALQDCFQGAIPLFNNRQYLALRFQNADCH